MAASSADNETKAIRLRRVTRTVDGETFLYPIDLAFESGSFTSLLGRTRAGKTSLLRLIAGLDRPSSGTVHVGARDVSNVHVRQRDVAMVYQQFVNYPSLTVFENIASPLRVQGVSSAEVERRVRSTAEALGLSPLLTRLPAELSGGQQQRTAIARALVKEASLILLDEPLANLDYKLREELRVQLRDLFRQRRAIVIYATAEPDEALLMGGRVVVLDEGRVLQEGAVREVYEQPASQRAGEIFSEPQLNLLALEVCSDQTGRLESDERQPLPPSLRDLTPGNYLLGVRPHHLQIRPESRAAGDQHGLRFAATTLVDEITGASTLLHVAADFGSRADGGTSTRNLTLQRPGIRREALGTKLELFVAARDLFVFDSQGRTLRSAAAPAEAV